MTAKQLLTNILDTINYEDREITYYNDLGEHTCYLSDLIKDIFAEHDIAKKAEIYRLAIYRKGRTAYTFESDTIEGVKKLALQFAENMGEQGKVVDYDYSLSNSNNAIIELGCLLEKREVNYDYYAFSDYDPYCADDSNILYYCGSYMICTKEEKRIQREKEVKELQEYKADTLRRQEKARQDYERERQLALAEKQRKRAERLVGDSSTRIAEVEEISERTRKGLLQNEIDTLYQLSQLPIKKALHSISGGDYRYMYIRLSHDVPIIRKKLHAEGLKLGGIDNSVTLICEDSELSRYTFMLANKGVYDLNELLTVSESEFDTMLKGLPIDKQNDIRLATKDRAIRRENPKPKMSDRVYSSEVVNALMENAVGKALDELIKSGAFKK